VAGFVEPSLNRGDGCCKFLGDDNLCTIYESRPWYCRVDENKPISITTKRWHEINKQACRNLGVVFDDDKVACEKDKK
jgi:Fe-S-cluster containining protein